MRFVEELKRREVFRVAVGYGATTFAVIEVAYHYLLLGESRRAAEWLQRAYQHRDVQLAFHEPVDLWRINADREAKVILEQPGLKELFEIRTRNARAAGEER